MATNLTEWSLYYKGPSLRNYDQVYVPEQDSAQG